ncbi:hypothetical protein Y032_0069g284 [Ancylostoma ceylanicum]|uniref:Helix-turn-helix domain-containing protein n=1 Tax=Ancylostoma ceylanicum TaxID=53326 RepID=A0A016TZ11_9BILA|nr:hypothetical protein Y032_0069g284 [Ancylostoma ceylanicum]
MESFDVTSLHTNVTNAAPLQALSEMLELHYRSVEMYGLSRKQVMILLKECLSCNTFKWSGTYFSQRGSAMSQRLAPVVATCFMSKIEEPVLKRFPLMYCPYIDDCCIVTSTQAEMDECFRILNQQSQYITLTRERPLDGWLSYLNTQLKLSNGTMHVKWYRKESSKNIIVHASSAHPLTMKRSIVRNMIKTAIDVSSGEAGKQGSLTLASSTLRSNGYQAKEKRARTSRFTS